MSCLIVFCRDVPCSGLGKVWGEGWKEFEKEIQCPGRSIVGQI
jgi:hypothetical protein